MLRSMQRNIAKNRMKDMGYSNVNKRIGWRKDKEEFSSEVISAMEHTRQGRNKLREWREKNPPAWKRILYGDLKKESEKAFLKACERRDTKKGKKKRKIKKVEAED